VKNDTGESVAVQGTSDFEVIPVNPKENLEGFNLECLYCLGCSWNGSIKKLKRFLQIY
jgi:hypothetical protein